MSLPGVAAAQRGGTPPIQGAGTLVGIVVTPAGVPIDSASVTISEVGRRETRTGADGLFRFNKVGDAPFDLIVRKVGFLAQRTRMKVERGGGSVRVVLPPVIRTLAPSITEAKLEGLGGVVGDTAYKALAGATVRVVASAAEVVTTDSLGAFYTPLKPGHYAVQVTKPGYQTTLTSVTIPEGGGKRISVLLTPGRSPTAAREAFFLDQLRERRVYAIGPFSKLWTREDIEKLNVDNMQQFASMAAVRRVDESCEVTLDGNAMDRMPVWALDVTEFAFVEVYGGAAPQAPGNRAPAGRTSLNGNRPIATQRLTPRGIGGAGPVGCPSIIAWRQR